MSIWEFTAAVEGYRRANSPKDDTPRLSPEEFWAMWERFGC